MVFIIIIFFFATKIRTSELGLGLFVILGMYVAGTVALDSLFR